MKETSKSEFKLTHASIMKGERYDVSGEKAENTGNGSAPGSV